MATAVNFWFDPTCPWTWITSRWLSEVAENRDLTLTWHTFSLWELNKERESELPAAYFTKTRNNAIASRVTGGVETVVPERLGEWYTTIGSAFHKADGAGAPINDETIRTALEDLGLDTGLVERAKAGEFDDFVASSTGEALEKVGNDVGVPIIEVAGVAFFGPVISPAPHGEEALSLWDGTLALARIPGFFELKRSRNVGPIISEE